MTGPRIVRIGAFVRRDRGPRFAPTADPATLLNEHPPPETHLDHAMCVGCGCTDLSPCAYGCTWLFVDRTPGNNTGLCSTCGELDPEHADLVARIKARRAMEMEAPKRRESRTIQALLLANKQSIEAKRGTGWVISDTM